MSINDIAILNIKGSGYDCIISLICKNEDINLLQNADLIFWEVLTFGNFKTEKKKYHHKSSIFLGDVDIGKVLMSNKIYFGEKTMSTLLITCTIIIKLSHCI